MKKLKNKNKRTKKKKNTNKFKKKKPQKNKDSFSDKQRDKGVEKEIREGETKTGHRNHKDKRLEE